jgi:large subunit ribosomal protein L29
MKIDSMVEWSAEERTAKEKEWRQALFTLRLQKATGQLENPMKIKELRKDLARLKTLVHMDAARIAAQKAHAEHEAVSHATTAAGAPPASGSGTTKKAAPKARRKTAAKGKARAKAPARKAAPKGAKKAAPAKKAAAVSAKKGKGR